MQKPWEQAAAVIKLRAQLDLPEQQMWLAVLTQAIKDIGSKYHSSYFWKEDNLSTYGTILNIDIDYIFKALNYAGYNAGDLI